MKHAFKEWAVICKALAEGQQALILRKGGIAENGGDFRPEHDRFWLYPTYLHQQEKGIKPAALPLLQQSDQERPGSGTVRIRHFVQAPGVYRVHNLASALLLDGLHLWSPATVRQRFEYRQPGLYVFPARVYQMPAAVELPETDYYAGCKSWVELERDLPTEGATPVISDQQFQETLRRIEGILQPTALA